MNKPKCPHCWSEMKEDQLTCDNCDGRDNVELTPLFIAAIFIGIALWVAVIIFANIQGWFK